MNKLLKKAIILILCMTFTVSLMGTASACPKSEEAYTKIFELFKDRDELLNEAIEDAKEKVCENLKISRELLDEVTKNVRIATTFGKKTEYIPEKNLILVAAWNMILDEHPSGINKETNLARELALAFIDNYLNNDREEVLAERVIIKAFADLCDKNIVPDSKRMDTPINLNEICCDKKQASGIYKNKIRRNLKYLAQEWLENGGLKVLENWVEEKNSIRE